MTETVQLWIEAEEGVLTSPMRVAEDNRASAGQYIWVPPGEEQGGKAAYRFHVPATGDYVVWGRVIPDRSSADSFFVALDDRDDILWDTQRGGTEGWVWDLVRQQGGDDPVIFFLEAVPHPLLIKQREAGTKIDRLDYECARLNTLELADVRTHTLLVVSGVVCSLTSQRRMRP